MKTTSPIFAILLTALAAMGTSCSKPEEKSSQVEYEEQLKDLGNALNLLSELIFSERASEFTETISKSIQSNIANNEELTDLSYEWRLGNSERGDGKFHQTHELTFNRSLTQQEVNKLLTGHYKGYGIDTIEGYVRPFKYDYEYDKLFLKEEIESSISKRNARILTITYRASLRY